MNAVIVAGGRNSRIQTNKALLEVGGAPIIERSIAVLSRLFDEIIVVANNFAAYEYLGLRMVSDLIPGEGPLSGIHAGLSISSSYYNFFVACDLPFLDERIIKPLMAAAVNPATDPKGASSTGLERSGQPDVIVPSWAAGLEPMHAIYSRRCIAPIARTLAQGLRRVVDFYPEVTVKTVDVSFLNAQLDLETSFMNVNTRADWEAAQQLAALQEHTPWEQIRRLKKR